MTVPPRAPGDISIGRRRALRLAAAPLILLGGCELAVPGQSPPPELYRLTPKSTFGEDLPRVEWQLVLEAPVANAGLNTTRIALQRDPMRLEYYARASWTDRAPLMVQTLMVESFENSKRIIAVGREAVGLRADFVLKSELREFQAEYLALGKPQVRVAMNAKLVRMPDRSIIGSQSWDRVAEASADNLQAVVRAFDEALGKVLGSMVEWTLVTGEAAVRRP